ncbi:fatty acid synthase-like [Mercenaria mercenaria]|uniref:fatty acid synthase-like n=1 Tax=Mercenaria mercenaria TaxID=6596 RepID=UPI00234F4DDF|nr:fatty acid synthase-like [Mercenaria mercenaria]
MTSHTSMTSQSDVVISGISCRLPMSNNMEELKNNLLNGVDTVQCDKPRMNTGLSWEETKVLAPNGVVLACHNAKDSVTVSGRKDVVETFVNTVLDKGIFAKLLNTNGIAFHSKDLKAVEKPFSKSLKQIIKSSRTNTEQWISTVMHENLLDSGQTRCFSADYLTKSLTTPVFFYEAIQKIPKGSVVIEVAPHCLLQPLLRRALSGSFCIAGLMKRGQTDMSFFLSNLGRCFEWGLNFNPQTLDGPALFPVPTGTPTGYLHLICKSFSKMLGKHYGSQAIKFRGVEFHSAVVLKAETTCKYDKDKTETKPSLAINILRDTGYFEVIKRDSLVATGFVFESCVNDIQRLKSTESNKTDDQNQTFELSRTDVYKELCLRGYNYGDSFQYIQASDLSGRNGLISWPGNWVTFLDAMLQYPLLNKMKRGLFLPRCIRECLIHPDMVTSLPVNAHTQVKYTLATGSCETAIAVIRGSHYVPVVYQPRDLSPLLESHTFVPYSFGNSDNRKKTALACGGDAITDKQNAKQQTETGSSGNKYVSDEDLMICVKLVLENSPNVINVLKVESKDLVQNIKTCISKNPLHTATYYVSSGNKIKEYKMSEDFYIRDRPLVEDSEHDGKDFNCFKNTFQLVLIRDDVYSRKAGTCISNVLSDDGKKKVCIMSEQSFFYISLGDFKWIENLKKLFADIRKTHSRQNLWLITEERNSGLLGLVKCLIHEEGYDKIRCIVNLSDSPIESQDNIMNDIVSADLAVNILNEYGCVGSLRYVPLKCISKIPTTNAQVRIKRSGDLSSLTWTQSEVESDVDPKKQNYIVCYSALNFRDVMIAAGKLSPSANPGQYTSPEAMLGMKFSGVDEHGKRVMGLVSDLKGISTSVVTRTDCVWAVPAEWTLEQAATVPMAYLSAYLALVVKGNVAKGETVLIHSGSGGLGQAAISIAVRYRCTIYTTVGSDEKMEFLLSKYPMLDKDNIFSSRTTDFEQKILIATGGAGVDIVLNSLAGDFLYASVRVLNSCGRFLEMGKYDLFQNASLAETTELDLPGFSAIVLKDGLWQNQDEETFRCAYEAKAQGVINLDILTRELFEQTCDWFVCFSSIVSGRGNIGQTNYGYANSITERVCENRAKDGLNGVKKQMQIMDDNSLSDLGLDSLMSIEVRQLLERQGGATMSLEQIQNMTIKQLKEMSNCK